MYSLYGVKPSRDALWQFNDMLIESPYFRVVAGILLICLGPTAVHSFYGLSIVCSLQRLAIYGRISAARYLCDVLVKP